jgi:hypothetical protein
MGYIWSPTKSVPKTMNIAQLSRDGWVAVRFGDRLELIISDDYERLVAAGQIPPGSSYQ